MPKTTSRAPLVITQQEKEQLLQIARSRKLPKREIERAQTLQHYHAGMSITEIAQRLGVTRPTVYKCIDKALAMGVSSALKDLPHSPKAPTITPEAKAWVIHLACCKPKELGYAAEVWSRSSLAAHVRQHAQAQGHPSLNKAAKATVHRILAENKLQPHKVKYYLERRDPDFEHKMREVLLVYKDVALANEKPEQLSASEQALREQEGQPKLVTLCVDEKPGVQALANTAPDLPPSPNQYPTLGRDYEYVRHGTASILAGIDLENGHVFAQVHRRHRSREFIALLQELDDSYPKDVVIRLILDNHSSHVSKETRKFLSSKPGRFIYVHTPKHGSWLNLAETLFGKMARTFLRHIRVASWDELKQRILQGVKEINENPVVHRWRKFDLIEEDTD